MLARNRGLRKRPRGAISYVGSDRGRVWSMIRKSGYRFSEKIMLKQKMNGAS